MEDKNLILEVKQMHKYFGDVQVLDDINIQVKKKEFIAIVGKSGCGKSTLLRLLAQLDQWNAGTVDFAMNTTTRIMYQDGRLLPWKTVLGNVRLGLKKEADARARVSLENVQLKGRENEWPSALSGGQQQRVALARALVHSPDLLLLDEPLGALDALTRREMQQLVEKLHIENQLSTILVTHDIDEAVALADRILVIEEGRIAYEYAVNLVRPRVRATPQFIKITEEILKEVLNEKGTISQASTF